MFALFYSAESKRVRGLNGSGRSAATITLEGMRKELGVDEGEIGKIPMTSVHAVTTPGAAAAWVDVVERFGGGKLSLEQILTPAIELAEEGFPVSELSSTFVSTFRQTPSAYADYVQWREGEQQLRDASPNYAELMRVDDAASDGCRAPRPGEIIKNTCLASVFRRLATHGKDGFYEGPTAQAIIQVVQDLGGHLSLEDLKRHSELGSEEVEPVSIELKRRRHGFSTRVDGEDGQGQEEEEGDQEGIEVWECPPNGQGLVALMALGILDELEKSGKIRRFDEGDHNCVE